MPTYTAIVERCAETGLYVGYIRGVPGAHTQAESLDELERNLREVVELLLEERSYRDAFPAGMSGPALRALHGAGIRTVAELAAWTEADLRALHGMGPKALRLLAEALGARGEGFSGPPDRP